MIDLINEILATLRHNKLRTALTGFAVSWGIFLLIVLLSVSRGIVNKMEDMFSSRDNEIISISGGWAHKPYKGLTEDRKITLNDRDMGILASQNANVVAEVSAEITGDSTVIMTSKDYLTDGYRGVYPSAKRNNGLTLLEGRFINDIDIEEGRRILVLHKESVKTLFGDKDAIGEQVKVNDLSFVVVGIYDHEWSRNTYIPFSTARNMSGESDKVRRIYIKSQGLKTMEDGMQAEKDFRATLGRQHSFATDDESAIWIWNRFNDYITTSTAMNVLVMAVWIIGVLTMLSGIVGVSNIMFVSVRERTHEIGVRRAIGAKPLSIIKQIILESVAITTLFGYIGIVLGVLVAQLIDMIFKEGGMLKDPTVDIAIALQVTLVLVIAGALAGLFPAMKSLKIKPVEALRDE